MMYTITLRCHIQLLLMRSMEDHIPSPTTSHSNYSVNPIIIKVRNTFQHSLNSQHYTVEYLLYKKQFVKNM